MDKAQLQILQISTADIMGGAEKVALNLFRSYRELGHLSWLAVGDKRLDDPNVLLINNDDYRNGWVHSWKCISNLLIPLAGKVKGAGRARNLLAQWMGEPRRQIEIGLGREDFDFPATRHLLSHSIGSLDIMHCHNLHGNYFDLAALPYLSQQVPVVLTLHDAWLLSGHCAHSFDCERWKTGCGHCPDLTLYPPIQRDATAYNWERKRKMYSESYLYVSAPCQWLMEKVKQSILAPAIIESRVIPYGVDLSLFRPADKIEARRVLGIRQDAKILLFAANGIRRNIWKDYQTMRATVALIAERLRGQHVLFIALGEDAPAERIGQAEIRFIPFQEDPADVARYYQAADIYLHAARADTFPNSILEALACGTPVVATEVGGISEQVKGLQGLSNGRADVTYYGVKEATGCLVLAGDAERLATSIEGLLINEEMLRQLGENASENARYRFDLSRQVKEYVDWYETIIERRNMERQNILSNKAQEEAYALSNTR